MKLSLNWLNDYVSYGIPPDKLAHKLTMAGLEVEKSEKIKGDTVFELEITPNRPDCLNILGLAREVSAILNKTLKRPKIKMIKFPKQKADITIEDRAGCSRYIGTLITNVDVAISPTWLRKRLESIDTRCINKIVDVTNFCLMEMGQPLHAFDYDKLENGKIIVRRAKKGETIITIDGEERTLDPSILIIADGKRPVAIAGIMGGLHTEVSKGTKNILLESAYFDTVLIRRAARKLGLTSESSYRFERGVDMDIVESGAHRALSLIKEVAGGQIEQRYDLFPKQNKAKTLTLRVSQNEMNTLLGADIPASRSKTILQKLNFSVSVSKKDMLVIRPPSCRRDIKIKEDIVEEISRIIGYDNLPSSMPQISMKNITSSSNKETRDDIRQLLTALGFYEIITYSMINQNSLRAVKMGFMQGTEIQNPITQDQEMMRPTMLPSMLSVVLSNFNRRQHNLTLFEIGKIYCDHEEQEVISLIMTGNRKFDWRADKSTQIDFYDIKGVVERLNGLAGNKVAYDGCQERSLEYERSADISLDGKKVGYLGKVKKEILVGFGIKQDEVYFAQVDAEAFYATKKSYEKFTPIPEFPSVVRDISIAVKKDITFAQIKSIVLKEKNEFFQSINFIEEYLGEKLPAGHKALVFSLTYQSPKRTLRDEEVTEGHEKICKALAEQLNAIRR